MFKVGDRVEYVGDFFQIRGKIGTIIEMHGDYIASITLDDLDTRIFNWKAFTRNLKLVKPRVRISKFTKWSRMVA